MEKNKNKNWIIQSGIGITLLIIILGSFVSPILIYMALLFIGVLSVVNMYRLDRHTSKADEVKPEDVPEAKEEPKQEITLEQKKAIEEVAAYIKKNISEGHDLKTVVESLVQAGYTEDFIMGLCVDMGIVKVTAPSLPDLGKPKKLPEIKEPVKKESIKEEKPPVEKTPKKKTKKQKKSKEKKEESTEEKE